MMNPIAATSSIPSIQNLPGISGGSPTAPDSESSGGFSKLIDQFVQQTNDSQLTSDQSIDDLITGKTDNVQQVVLAVANAEMSFQLFMEIRNKLIDSYNELMRMQF